MAEEGSEIEKRPADHLARLTAERRRQNRIRTVLGGGVFALFLLFALTIMQQFRNFDSARLEVKMNARASASLWPIVSQELDALTPKALPSLDEAFQAESPRFLPRLSQHLMAESERFSVDSEAQGDRILDEAIHDALGDQAIGITRFKESLSDDPELAGELFDAVLERAQGWARAELDHVMESQESVLSRLREQSQILEQAGTDAELLDDLLMSLIEVLQHNSGSRR